MGRITMKNGVYFRGSTWSAHARVTDPATGKRKTITKGGFATEDEAIVWREGTQTDDRRGERRPAGRESLAEYLEEWLDLVDVRPKTLAGYRSHVRRYVVPRIGGIQLRDLTASDLTRFYTALRRDGRLRGDGGALGLPSIRAIHRTLRSALTFAVDLDRIQRNPAMHAKLPRDPRPTTRAELKKLPFRTLTPDELRRFLAEASKHRLGALFWLAAFTAARRGELLYLRWEDIRLEEKIIEYSGSRSVADRAITEGPTKNEHQRRVAISDEVVSELRRHRKDQLEERLKAGEFWRGAEEFVFTQTTGEPIHPDTPSKMMRSLCAAAGVPRVRLHDLRHTHASLLFDAGVGAHEIADRLGHSNVRTTLDTYVHAPRDPNPHLADAFAERLASDDAAPAPVADL